MKQTGRVAIVTGSSRGVGAATVKLLSERGWNVVINFSKSEKEAREVQAACEALKVETLLCRADVSNDDECRALVNATMKKWGRLDALVNNAGTTKFCNHSDLEGLSKDDFLHIYSANVIGPYQMIRAAAPHLKKAGKAAIVNVASIAGVLGVGSSVAYCASKAALVNLTTTMARILGPEVRVNAVCPGFIQGKWLREGMGEAAYENTKKFWETSIPLKRTATAETVADTIVYLIEGAPLITGEAILLDAGFHLSGILARR